MMTVLVMMAQDLMSEGMNRASWIAVLGSVFTFLVAVITVVSQRAKTSAEAKKLDFEGDSSLVQSASEFLAQTGEFGHKLMGRISALEQELEAERTARRQLADELNVLKVELGRYQEINKHMSELRTQLGQEQLLRIEAERDVARLEAIIVTQQWPIGERD